MATAAFVNINNQSVIGAACSVATQKRKDVTKEKYGCTPFLIFSMPRCRSSWLSNLLTTDRSICLHDHAAYAESLPVLPYKYVGMCCTGAVHEADKWMDKYPEAPVVVLLRDPLESAKRLSAVIGEHVPNLFTKIQHDKLLDLSQRPNVFTVRFESMDQLAPDIFRKCLPDVMFDWDRFNQLKKLNIQPDPVKLRTEIKFLRSSNWTRTP